MPRLVGMGSGDYARRCGARWRPTHPAMTIDWPVPRTLPGGPGTPLQIDFGRLLQPRIPELGVLEIEGATLVRPWGWLIGSLIALFMSLGANGYLSMLLAQMRQRYLRDIQQGVVRV